jgi:hypothetical protein
MTTKMKMGFVLQLACLGCFVSCKQKTEADYYKEYQVYASTTVRDTMFKYIYSGIPSEFPYYADSIFFSKRSYFNDSNFIDYNIFGSSDTDVFCSINFKIENGIWYVFSGEEWQIFYGKGHLFKVNLLYSSQELVPRNKYTLNGEELLSFTDDAIGESFFSHQTTYFFSPKYGIVIIGKGDHYRREDFSPIGLKVLMDSIRFAR